MGLGPRQLARPRAGSGLGRVYWYLNGYGKRRNGIPRTSFLIDRPQISVVTGKSKYQDT